MVGEDDSVPVTLPDSDTVSRSDTLKSTPALTVGTGSLMVELETDSLGLESFEQPLNALIAIREQVWRTHRSLEDVMVLLSKVTRKRRSRNYNEPLTKT